MNPTIQLAAVTVLAPAAGAIVILWLGQRFVPREVRRGWAALAFAGGFWLGYALLAWLQNRSDFAPTRHWQWIPYLTLLAAAVAAATTIARLHFTVRLALLAVVAIASAWLLVPTWPDLAPSRAITIPILAAYIFLLTILLDSLETRLSPTVITAQLALSAVCSAGLIAAFVSLTYGEPAGIAGAVLLGCAVGAWLFPDVLTMRALALCYAVNVGGWAFTGAINPRPPLFALLATPWAPVALWICARGWLGRKQGFAAIVLQTAVVVAVLVIAGGLAWLATSDQTDGEW